MVPFPSMASVIVVAAAALSGAVATNEALSMAASSSASLAGLRRYFARSDEDHDRHMESILHNMNSSLAMRVLEQHERASPALLQFARRALKTHSANSKRALLRGKRAPNYGGFQPALDLINSMLYESMKKYDTEVEKCTGFYTEQCGMLQTMQSDIGTCNYKSATCREHTLAAQQQISLAEDAIPNMKQALKQQKLKCEHEVHELRKRLEIVKGDVEVLTKILDMSDCSKSNLMQLDLLHCQSNCNNQKFVSIDHEGLQTHLSRLQSPVALKLVQQGFAELSSSGNVQTATPAPANMTSKPTPRTQVPDSPCADANQKAPAPLDKRTAKCSITGSPSCPNVQERFLLIQAGTEDERDEILDEIAKLETSCEATTKNLRTQLDDEDRLLGEQQTKLADSMTCEATAAEESRLANKNHDAASADLKAMLKACSGNYQHFETEMCGLKKIRGELYKMRGGGGKQSFFQDCMVGKWEPSECSKTCGGGVQKVTRAIATQPIGGAKCLPLAQMKSCEVQPCPIDCRLDEWQAWSRCSAECGGGVKQRLRDVKRHMKYNGKPCGEASETKTCNAQSCESDCELSDWGPWTACSKECNSGTRKRQKWIKNSAVGQGSCPGLWDGARLEYAQCNAQRCRLQPKATTLTCKAPLDVVLLIDGSASVGAKGWSAELKAAQAMISAFDVDKSQARIAVITYSGPTKWIGIHKCFGRSGATVDMKKDCRIDVVSHFTDRSKFKEVKTSVQGLKWPKGVAMTSLALETARSELALGRKDARSVVVVFTRGRPLSPRRTWYAARDVRKAARLLWVPISRFAPLKFIKRLATRRWQENVVAVKDFDKLTEPVVVNSVIADVCPSLGGATQR